MLDSQTATSFQPAETLSRYHHKLVKTFISIYDSIMIEVFLKYLESKF